VPTREDKIEAAVLAYIDAHGQIRTRDVPALLGVGMHTASNVLKRLKDRGVIAVGSRHSTGRSVFYVRPTPD
jgi:Mn-dependent DtxR family transcriptional regulator